VNHRYFQYLFVIVTILACAAGSSSAREKPQPKSQVPAGPAQKPAAPAAEQKPAIPVVPMEEFAAEPDPDTAAKAADVEADEPSACRMRIAGRIAVIEPLPVLSGPGDCGATDVVRLEAVIMPDKSRVALTPPATVRCTMAEAIATWVRDDLTASAAALGSTIRNLDNYASYDCRGRNRIAGARISQHGMANAIDVRGVHLANGKFADFTDRKLARDVRESLRKRTCERFTTVLGPGSDGFHEDHIHVDLAERRGGYRLCQWNVLAPVDEIPLPRPRPAEAP